MNDTLDIGGENLISSKRAADLSGYAQDYIGQLARKGLIEAKRVGGLWYVSLDSLNVYKTSSETYTPRPPQAASPSRHADSIISFDGRDYVSAARAAQITGYHPDYVGQLARSGKIMSRQIGNRWYVDRDRIISHKEEKDALLGAVQAESAGLARPDEEKSAAYRSPEPFFKYRTDGRDLIPRLNNNEAYGGLYGQYKDLGHPIPIRRERHQEMIHQYPSHDEPYRKTSKGIRKKIMIALLSTGAVIVVAFGVFFVINGTAPSASPRIRAFGAEAVVHSRDSLEVVTDWFGRLFGKELTYEKD